jgi:hypothetical protein
VAWSVRCRFALLATSPRCGTYRRWHDSTPRGGQPGPPRRALSRRAARVPRATS